jgi:ATP-dependent protease ClpP protease subunit
MQRPMYMRPQDALQYNIIDEIIQPDQDKVGS